MGRRTVPVALVVAAALAERLGAPSLAFYALLLAVPAAAVVTLTAVAELVDGTAGRAQPLLWGAALALIVVAAAARAPALAAGIVPRTGESALLACLTLFCTQAAGALASELFRLRTEACSLRAWPGRSAAAPRRTTRR